MYLAEQDVSVLVRALTRYAQDCSHDRTDGEEGAGRSSLVRCRQQDVSKCVHHLLSIQPVPILICVQHRVV